MARRDFAGGAVATTLDGSITASSLVINIVSSTGWPVGANGPFFIVINRGGSSEEKILVTTRSAETLSVASASDRGVDGTSASSHNPGESVEHCHTATDADEANSHINDTGLDAHTQYLNIARHDVSARHTFGAALGTPGAPASVGTTNSAGAGSVPARSDHVHKIGAGAIDSSSMFAVGVVDGGALADNSVGTGELLGLSVTTAKIVDDAVTTVKILNANVTTAKLNDLAVTTVKLADDSVTDAKIANNLPRGEIAYVTQAADEPAITTTETVVLSCPANIVDTRKYKVTVHFRSLLGTVTNDIFTLRIRKGGVTGTRVNEINSLPMFAGNGVGGGQVVGRFVATATEATTFDFTMVRAGGTGSCVVSGHADFPIFVLVEDVGG